MTKQAREKLNTTIIHIVLILLSATMLIPFIWMILTAFKTQTEAASINPFIIFPSVWHWENFTAVISTYNFPTLYLNTLLLIFFRVICAVLTATMGGSNCSSHAKRRRKRRGCVVQRPLYRLLYRQLHAALLRPDTISSSGCEPSDRGSHQMDLRQLVRGSGFFPVFGTFQKRYPLRASLRKRL